MSDDRRLAVLRAIVEDYVSTHEPVGSKALVERHQLGVSPATIRNDMAVLEDEGYITQPHTSAGRIPTDRGYRLFVDRLANVKPMTPAEKRAIETFLHGADDLDDVVDRTVRLLAQLTRQAAVVQYPSLSRATVRHVELVGVGGRSALLVLITDSGRVEQRVLDIRSAVDVETLGVSLAALRTRVNATVAGKRLREARPPSGTASRRPWRSGSSSPGRRTSSSRVPTCRCRWAASWRPWRSTSCCSGSSRNWPRSSRPNAAG
jgi:heat-inducible transcriptional repressor